MEVKILRGLTWEDGNICDIQRGDIFQREDIAGYYEAYSDAEWTIEGWQVAAAWYVNDMDNDA